MVVTILNIKEKEELGTINIESLITVIRGKELKKATEEILALRKFLSNNLLIITLSVEVRLQLKRNLE